MSIATCNKLFENMTPFYADNNKTKILGTVNGKTFYWKIYTGSAVTCMNINSFEMAFGKRKEDSQKEYKTDIFIKKRKSSHTVQISDEFSENILGIDFLQKFRLHLDSKTQQIKFLPMAYQFHGTICNREFYTTSICNSFHTSPDLPSNN